MAEEDSQTSGKTYPSRWSKNKKSNTYRVNETTRNSNPVTQSQTTQSPPRPNGVHGPPFEPSIPHPPMEKSGRRAPNKRSDLRAIETPFKDTFRSKKSQSTLSKHTERPTSKKPSRASTHYTISADETMCETGRAKGVFLLALCKDPSYVSGARRML